jgi:class 3 adenylate cyclase
VVNVASRLNDASPEGEIWVGTETYRYTRNDFEYEALRPLNLVDARTPGELQDLHAPK